MTINRLPFQVVHELTPLQAAPAIESTPVEHFPSARYFQVHFQYLHEYNQLLQTQVAELKLQLDRLNSKLARIHSTTDDPGLSRSS
jgi:hypothetical protein